MKANRFYSLLASLFLFLGCQSAAQPRIRAELDAPQGEQELRQVSAEWDRAYNTADVKKLAMSYAEDVISMPPNSPSLHGRKALQTDFESFFANNVARHETMIDKIVKDGDLAIEAAHYRLTYKPRAGGAETVETGRHLECRRKIDGRWQIVLEIWNSDAPASK